MKPRRTARGVQPHHAAIALAVVCLALAPGPARAQGGASGGDAAPTDIGWPRQIPDGSSTITVYQPQVESWKGNQLQARAAISVTTAASPTPTFGVVWFTARTDVDKAAHLVTLDDFAITRTSFPGAPDQQSAYQQTLQAALPPGARTIALDRLQANLSITQAEQGPGATVEVKNSAPRIFFSDKPAILVLVDGKPALRQVEGSGNLLRVINTRGLLLLDQGTDTYYLYVMNRWASASSLDGPWASAPNPPAGLDAAKQSIVASGQVDLLSDPGNTAKSELEQGVLPAIFVATGPAELLQTTGKPSFAPIGGTQLLEVSNSTSDIFLEVTNQDYYVLVSGRWFRSRSLSDGDWAYVPADSLPADFAQIPYNHPRGSALVSVSGTPQAKEAVISSTIPQTATVSRTSAQMPPAQYDGEPKFESIEGTSLQYAVNTATPVIQVAPGSYYAVVNGVWFTAASPNGPWVVAAAVPPAIYTIPPSSPLYYATYVNVYGATPEFVYTGYMPGYYGTYLVPAGTVVYGTGYVYDPWIGSVWIGPPYTYGFGAGFAWGAFTGFALGYAAGAYCHPWWGPAGWGWGWGGNDVHVNVNQTNIYNRWGKNTVWSTSGGKYAGHVGNTTFAGDKGGDVYADRNGNVYRRDDGTWQKYDNGQWNDTNWKSQAKDSTQAQNLQNKAQQDGGLQDFKSTAEQDGRAQDARNEAQQDGGLQDFKSTAEQDGGAQDARDKVQQDAALQGTGNKVQQDDGLQGSRGDQGSVQRAAASRPADLGSLDSDWSARQQGDRSWQQFSQGASDRFADGGDRFGSGGGGGGGFGGGFGGGLRGGGGRR